MLNAAKILALTTHALFKNTKLIEEAKKEFYKKRGLNYNYDPLIGDRKPALEYRN
jgi:aminobenzoyl-glutamate utilization protein B